MQQLSPEVEAAIARGRHDIVFFAWYFLGLTLHPGQIRFLRGANGIVNILVPGNRYGKTVILAVRHIWHNFYKIGLYEGDGEAWEKAEYKTAALAPSGEVLEVMFKTIIAIMTSSFPVNREGQPLKNNFCRIQWFLVPERCRSTAPYMIQFQQNSYIKFHSGSDDKFSSVQGKKYGYGGYDEGGRSYHLEYELKSNLIPRFQELEAPIDLASTPDQKSPSIAYHYDIFQKGLKQEQGFISFEGSADENVYLPASYFNGIERAYQLDDGSFDPLYEQVRYGKFVFGGTASFRSEDIDAAIDESLNGGQDWRKGHRYIIGSDTATSHDEIAHIVLDVPEGTPSDKQPMRLVNLTAFRGFEKSPDMHVYDFTILFDDYAREGLCRHNLECFNEGGQIFYKNLPKYIQRKTKHYAWGGPPGQRVKNEGTNGFKKAELIVALKKALTRRCIRIPNDPELIKQLRVYREDDDKLKQDRVMALACAAWMAIEGKPEQQILEPQVIAW